MYVQRNFQDAGWAPDVVKRESDDDSDAEDDWVGDVSAVPSEELVQKQKLLV